MYIFHFVKKRVKTSMFTSEHDIVLLWAKKSRVNILLIMTLT